MASREHKDFETFGFEPGRKLVGKYVVGEMLGKGWEGEVYHVTEQATGIERAAKFFFPQRNPNNKTITFYAKKLNKLRTCPIIIQYHTQELLWYHGYRIPFLVSEYVQGELLSGFLKRQRGHRLHYFEAMHLLHTLAAGVEQIHRLGEYHGDLHDDNVIVQPVGIGFKVKLVDLYYWGRCTAEHVLDDVCALIRLFYDAVGGARHYASQPPEVKAICCGLKRSLIQTKFRTAGDLREYLQSFEWL